jgi:hypothetical protein
MEEKEAIAESLEYLVDIAGKNTKEGRKYISRIFGINPGGAHPVRIRASIGSRLRALRENGDHGIFNP